MPEIIDDSIDFSAYELEPELRQGVKPASSWVDAVVKRMLNPEEISGARLPWDKTAQQVRLRPHELTLWPGINGHGKSMALSHVMLGCMAQRQRVMIASLEMRPELTLDRMTRQALGKRNCSIHEIHAFHRWTDGKLWLYDHVGALHWRKMLAVCRYAIATKQVDHVVIDSLMRLGIGEQDYDGQKAAVDALCNLRNDYPVHVHLVMHSRKLADEFAPPGKFDAKGSGTMTDLADNVLTVWRNKRKESDPERHRHEPDAMLICDKQRNGEWEGKIGLWFDRESMQFLESDDGYSSGFVSSPEHSLAS